MCLLMARFRLVIKDQILFSVPPVQLQWLGQGYIVRSPRVSVEIAWLN